MKITYTELFPSLQGEGLYQGVPSIFLRLFGCNFRCNNFNLPRDTKGDNLEVQQIIKDIDKYKMFEELPLVSTGCDTYASIRPEFKHLAKTVDVKELASSLVKMMDETGITDIVITGGEPLLPGQQRKLTELLTVLYSEYSSFSSITFETNGTQEMSNDLLFALRRITDDVIMSVSVKLANSGESWSKRVKASVVASLRNASDYTFLKFVVSDDEDLEEIEKILNVVTEYDYVYLMPVGGVSEVYAQNAKWVAEQCVKMGYRYSPRLQVDLWKNQWGT